MQKKVTSLDFHDRIFRNSGKITLVEVANDYAVKALIAEFDRLFGDMVKIRDAIFPVSRNSLTNRDFPSLARCYTLLKTTTSIHG
jgi:hypothetical protein